MCEDTTMLRFIEGNLNGAGMRIAIVVARFNSLVTDRLLDGALDALARYGVAADDIVVARVPGSLEIPLVARGFAMSGVHDAVICLGAVVRGATPHFDYVAAGAANGIAGAGLDSGRPVIFGVLTCETMEQALDRAGGKAGNKGFDAAVTAIEMVNVMKGMA
jgi:6,7-dimethyl-8-ribityllumazine synthase